MSLARNRNPEKEKEEKKNEIQMKFMVVHSMRKLTSTQNCVKQKRNKKQNMKPKIKYL